MKTYKDISNITAVTEAMEELQCWSIIADNQSVQAAHTRDYNLMKQLAGLSVNEIIGFSIRIAELVHEFLISDSWTKDLQKQLIEDTGHKIETLIVWSIFQGEAFYEEVFKNPSFLFKRKKQFNPEEIPDNKVMRHALALRIGEEYIHYSDFVGGKFKNKLVW